MTSASSGAPATAPHVLVIVQACDPHPGEDHEGGCYDRSIECPGPAASCVAWDPCTHAECLSLPLIPGREDPEQTFHGVDHHWMGTEGWGVESTNCYYATSAAADDAVGELLPLAPGRYPVNTEFDGDYPAITLVEEPSNV